MIRPDLKTPKGQALPWVMLIIALILALVFSNLDRMHLAAIKIKQQRKTDAIAMKMGAEYSRSLNALAGINQGIDQMAVQFIFYASSSITAVTVLFLTGVGILYLISAGVEFSSGFIKILKAIKAIGQDFEKKITKIDSQIFPNLCQTLKQEKWVVLKNFIEDHDQLILEQLEGTSFDSLDNLPMSAVSTLVSLIQHPLVYSYPDVCDPDVQKKWHALTRVESEDAFVECKPMDFRSYHDYQGYQKIDWTEGSLVSGSVVFTEVLDQDIQGTRLPIEFTEYYGQSTASNVPGSIVRDFQGQESDTANTTFEFKTGHFESCLSAKNIWRSLGNVFTPFPIPDYVQLDETFSDKNKIMVAIVQPYMSIKPFRKSTDLADYNRGITTPWDGVNDVIHTYQEYQNTIESIARTIDQLFSQAQMVTTYAQVSVTGKGGHSNLNTMHFFPKLMDTTLETWMTQELKTEFE